MSTTMTQSRTEAAAVEGEILFEEGIPGFAGLRRFALVSLAEDSAFSLLQSLEDADVAMVVAVPWLFFPDYAPELAEADRESLDLRRPEDAVIFCPVTLDRERNTVYLNLLGPFVVNAATRRGRQVVLADSGYPVRAPVNLAGG